MLAKNTHSNACTFSEFQKMESDVSLVISKGADKSCPAITSESQVNGYGQSVNTSVNNLSISEILAPHSFINVYQHLDVIEGMHYSWPS